MLSGLILLLWVLFELFFYYLFLLFGFFIFGYGELSLLDQAVYKLFEDVHNFILFRVNCTFPPLTIKSSQFSPLSIKPSDVPFYVLKICKCLYGLILCYIQAKIIEYFYNILIYNDRFWVLWLEIDKIHKNISLILLEFNIKLDNGDYLHIFNT